MSDKLKNNKELMEEYNYKKNNDINLEDLTLGSGKKIWWKCKQGHEWQATICNRSRINRGCPYCSGRFAILGENDLFTLYPNLEKEWNYEKNVGINPRNVKFGSNKKVWWKCSKCGYEWTTTVCSRTVGNTGCRMCKTEINKEKKIMSNDEFVKRVKEIGNGEYEPITKYTCSRKKVKLKHLICGNVYDVLPNNFLNKNRRCPYCSNYKIKKGFNDLFTCYPYLEKEWDYEKNVGIDPYILAPGTGKLIWWKCKYGHKWRARINSRTIKHTNCPICSKNLKISFPEKTISFYLSKVFEIKENILLNDLFNDNPCGMRDIDIYVPCLSIAIYYDGPFHNRHIEQDKKVDEFLNSKKIKILRIKDRDTSLLNDNIAIEKVFESDKNLNNMVMYILDFIRIECGVSKKIDINYLRDLTLIYKYMDKQHEENSILKISNNIINEWDYEKNNNLSPGLINKNSNKKFWWKCEKGHSYTMSPSCKIRGQGCPYCANKKILSGYNDLQTRYPNLVSEWDFTKNNDILPNEIFPGSSRKVWWKCEKGHSYLSSPNTKTKGVGCPYCSGRSAISGINDICTTNPELLLEWDYEKNSGINPNELKSGSNKKVWWKCNKGHEWQATICNRSNGRNCPYCAHNKR